MPTTSMSSKSLSIIAQESGTNGPAFGSVLIEMSQPKTQLVSGLEIASMCFTGELQGNLFIGMWHKTQDGSTPSQT
jgi:hypothetical protein